MFIGRSAARRRSVARRGLETARGDQFAAGFAGLVDLVDGLVDDLLDDLCLCALLATGFRATGLMVVGASAAAFSSGSGLNCARQAGESWDLLRAMQAVTRATSGISELQSRNASPVQACSCSGV